MSESFEAAIARAGHPGLRRARVRTLQVNVGRRCDLACHHCHVEAGPKRSETLNARVADAVIRLLERSPEVETLDLTGGAPELCTEFRRLVRAARAQGREVIDRCNLTVLFEPGQEDTAEFLAAEGVRIVASLPCYGADNVDRQRGRGVFERSIRALRLLNGLGYGLPGSALGLDLVYNPQGPSLPPAQPELEDRYREELRAGFGIEFHHLATIANMPIKRFAHALTRDGQHEAYMALLVNHFNPETIPALMCRHLLSIAWDGTLHDCDFNQMLEIPLGAGPRSLFELDDLSSLEAAPVATAPHCFGCTAGHGSSCGGALT